jgi:small-conductance mechanosensitive channel
LVVIVSKVGIGLLILFAFWISSRIARRTIRRISRRTELSPDVEELFEQGVVIFVLGLGVITALGTMGVDVTALAAGLGLTGFALGFALRDAVSNMLAGVMILVYEPFSRDDRLSVLGHEGRVADIDLRYTVLEYEDKRILIPNTQLFSKAVVVKDRASPGRDD